MSSQDPAVRKLKILAKEAARAQGCTCNVKVEVIGRREVNIRHDDWCPLLTAVRTQQQSPNQIVLSFLRS